MKKDTRKKLIHLVLLAVAVVATVEFQNFMKNRAEECEDGICKLPAEKAGALVGPQSVPLLPATDSAAQKPMPELIDFGAGKCSTCKMMDAVLQELSQEYSDSLRIRIIDVWENKEASEAHSIRMIPTQLFFDAEGNELYRHEGFISKQDILNKWEELGVDLSEPTR